MVGSCGGGGAAAAAAGALAAAALQPQPRVPKPVCASAAAVASRYVDLLSSPRVPIQIPASHDREALVFPLLLLQCLVLGVPGTPPHTADG